MRGTPEALRERLKAPGVHLKPVAGGYELRLTADGRRRAVDRLSAADLRAVQALGPLTRHADGRLSLMPPPDDLSGLIREGYFDRLQLLALDQWRRDHATAYAADRLTQDWSRFGGGGRSTAASDLPLYRLQARRRCEEAAVALGDLAAPARRVGLEDWPLSRATCAPEALTEAFTRLSGYYRIGG